MNAAATRAADRVFELKSEIHQKLIGDIERVLSDQVPEKYLVRLEERAYIALAGAEARRNRVALRTELAEDLARRRGPGATATGHYQLGDERHRSDVIGGRSTARVAGPFAST